ncbi:hypothetical protein GCM10009076_11580 [Erythrobacter ramosus]
MSTATRTATYTEVDVANVVRRVKADLFMIADSTGAITRDKGLATGSSGWLGIGAISRKASALARRIASRVSDLAPIALRNNSSVSVSRYISLGLTSAAPWCAHLFLTDWSSFSQERASRGKVRLALRSNQF